MKESSMKYFLNEKACVCFLLLVMIAAAHNVFAQDDRSALTVRIDQIITTDFPNMTIYAIVENDRGEVVLGLAPALFSFRINSFAETGRSTITQFALRNAPIDYTIIFSNSGIMAGEPLAFQKNAIIQFVEFMRENDRLSLYTIGEEATVIFEELRRDEIDPAVINAVDITAAQPRLNDSIINVLRRVQRRRIERRVVIVISDGRDIDSRFNTDQLNAVLSEVGIPVYSLGFNVLGLETLANLHDMAERTGGAYIFVPQLSALPGELRNLNARIAQPYVINLRARSLRADDLPHVLEVAVEGWDFAGRGHGTFIATRVPIPQWVNVKETTSVF
jgi:hypothetical protein